MAGFCFRGVGVDPFALAAEWITAIGTAAIAIAAWVQFPLISKQVRALSQQIRLSREAEQNTERRAREWETIKACERYNFDPVIEAATFRVWNASDHCRDYKLPAVDKRDLIVVLNYLDGIAIGVAQGLYIETIVRDHIGTLFHHAVVKYVESGLVETAGIEATLALHAKWFKSARPTTYVRPA